MKIFIFGTISVVVVAVSLTYSRHGLRDFLKMRSQVVAADQRIEVLENQNAELRRQMDTLDRNFDDALESYAREKFGMAAVGERIYVEKVK